MPTDFSSQLLQNVILDLSETDDSRAMQGFSMRASDVGALRVFYDNRDGLLSPSELSAIENLRNSNQTVTLNLYKKKAPGTGSTRVRRGVGSPEVADITPTFFDIIEEGVDMSYVNQALRQYGPNYGVDAKVIIERAYTDHLRKFLPQVFRNIYTRANAQYLAFIEANVWANNSTDGTADAGNIYSPDTTLNSKSIPLADRENAISNLQIEAQQNNFLSAGTPSILASPRFAQLTNEYLKYGANNDRNLNQFVGWFNTYIDNAIVDAAGNTATMYLVYPGGVAGYQRTFAWDGHPDTVNGKVIKGNDSWERMTIGGNDTKVFTGLPEVKLEVKRYGGWEDTSATYNVDEANIDIVQNWSFVTQFGAVKALGGTDDESPIMKYVLANS